MARIRLNNEYRNKVANRIKVHLFQEDTQEKRKYDDLKGQQIDINDNAWKVAEQIVRRHYTDDDVEKAYYLQNKFENVSTIAKDSCFHFHYLGQAEEKDYDNNVRMVEKPIEKHFDFRLLLVVKKNLIFLFHGNKQKVNSLLPTNNGSIVF
jgi:hypothetical protein